MNKVNGCLYDREYYLRLKKSQRYSVVQKTVNDLVIGMHNPKLVCDDGVTFFKIHSDGSITKENGDVVFIRHECVRPSTFFTFPEKSNETGRTYGVMSVEDCQKVRNLMDEMLLEI